MSRYCSICRNTNCDNHGKFIAFYGANWECKYIPIPTNADRIRNMTDKEMVTELIPMIMEICEDGVPGDDFMLEWLQRPFKED